MQNHASAGRRLQRWAGRAQPGKMRGQLAFADARLGKGTDAASPAYRRWPIVAHRLQVPRSGRAPRARERWRGRHARMTKRQIGSGLVRLGWRQRTRDGRMQIRGTQRGSIGPRRLWAILGCDRFGPGSLRRPLRAGDKRLGLRFLDDARRRPLAGCDSWSRRLRAILDCDRFGPGGLHRPLRAGDRRLGLRLLGDARRRPLAGCDSWSRQRALQRGPGTHSGPCRQGYCTRRSDAQVRHQKGRPRSAVRRRRKGRHFRLPAVRRARSG